MITIELNRLVKNDLLWDFEYDFYTDDISIKKQFQKLFQDYYFFDEIGFETIGRFKQRLMTRLNLKMPYYKQLYYTELKSRDIEFLLNKDYRETMRKVKDNSKTSRGTNENNGTNSSTTEGNNMNTSSNISDGVAKPSLKEGFVTSVSKDTNNANLSENSNVNGSFEGSETNHDNEEYELVGKGNIGVTSSAELLQKWREVLLNINEMIINECRDLFMLVY